MRGVLLVARDVDLGPRRGRVGDGAAQAMLAIHQVYIPHFTYRRNKCDVQRFSKHRELAICFVPLRVGCAA